MGYNDDKTQHGTETIIQGKVNVSMKVMIQHKEPKVLFSYWKWKDEIIIGDRLLKVLLMDAESNYEECFIKVPTIAPIIY